MPLGVVIALAMPRKGFWVSVCLVLMALPLLIPWNVVGTIWQIFALPDIGLLGYTLNALGIDYNYTRQPVAAWITAHRDGRLALDLAGRAARATPACQSIPDAYYQAAQDRRRLAAGRSSATSSCRR